MTLPVRLSEASEQLEIQSEELCVCFNTRTGELSLIEIEELSLAEELSDDAFEELIADSPDWEESSLRLTRQAAQSQELLILPSKYDVNEWNIMRDFACSQSDDEARDALLDAIHGAGAFRMFRQTIRLLKKGEEWEKFKKNAIKQIIVDWCRTNKIPYVDE